MGSRTKEQKQKVNDVHCCVCFKLRTTILACICIGIIMIIVYGYEYWGNPHLRDETPPKFYGYICVAGIEFILSMFGWIGAHNHIRSITKYFTYWVIVHIPIIVIIFWVSSLFDYLHFGFLIAWAVIQVLLLLLLWKYKQILKMTYGWGDQNDEDEQEQTQEIETEQISVTSEEPKKDANNGANVNVSINLTMAQPMYQQQQLSRPMQPMPQPMYQQPIQPIQQHFQPLQQPMQQNYPMQRNPTQAELRKLQHNPPNAPYQSQQNFNNLSDIVKQADPPMMAEDEKNENNVRISVYSTNTDTSNNEEIIQQQTTDYGDDVALYEKPRNRAVTNQGKYAQQGEGEGRKDMIVKSETDMSGAGYQTNMGGYAQQMQQQRPRINTPDPPPPPMQGNDEELPEDYIMEVKPSVPLKKQETKGVNLYFLDSGDGGGATGYQGNQ